jgi:hypothetical protein
MSLSNPVDTARTEPGPPMMQFLFFFIRSNGTSVPLRTSSSIP